MRNYLYLKCGITKGARRKPRKLSNGLTTRDNRGLLPQPPNHLYGLYTIRPYKRRQVWCSLFAADTAGVLARRRRSFLDFYFNMLAGGKLGDPDWTTLTS